MKIEIIQFEPQFGNKDKNIQTMSNYIHSSISDIIIFPELSTTGYDFSNRNEVLQFAESMSGPSIEHFSYLSEKSNKIIILGFAEISSDKCFNSAAMLFPDSQNNCVYRKTHLFFREKFCFDAGNTGFFVINDEMFDINIGTMLCYDWRFPEAARTLGLKGADLIACPSNLVTDVWHISMPSRALENKVYLACANRTGIESRNGNALNFKGKSAIYDFNGNILAEASANNEESISAEIEPEKTRNKKFNDFNDIFGDRMSEFYFK